MTRSPRTKATLLALVLTMLTATAANVATAAPSSAPLPRWVRVYQFRAAGPGELAIEGVLRTGGERGVFGFAAVTRDIDSGETTVEGEVTDFGGEGEAPRSYGLTPALDPCASYAICKIAQVSDGGEFTVGVQIEQDEGHRGYAVDYYLFGDGHVRLSLERMVGFRRVATRTGGFDRVDTRSSRSAGATAGGLYAESFSTATASARRPSIAIAPSACQTAGAGIVTLFGGDSPQIATCPAGQLADRSMSPTAWVVTGPAVGISANATRLLVLDR